MVNPIQTPLLILATSCALLEFAPIGLASTTSEGTRGLWRVEDARRLPPSAWVQELSMGFWDQTGLILPNQKHREIAGQYSFTYRPGEWSPTNRLEWSLFWEANDYTIEDTAASVRESTNTLGDFGGRVKAGLVEKPWGSFALGAGGKLFASEGRSLPAWGSFSPSVLALASFSPTALTAIHLNAGYKIDNSEKTFRSLNPYPSRGVRAAQGVDGDDRWLIGIGAEAVWGRFMPFTELTADIDADGKARTSNGEFAKVSLTQNPIRLTPGLRINLGPISVDLATDLGFLSSDFPREGPILPAWQAMFGIRYVHVPVPIRYGRLRAQMIDYETEQPLSEVDVLVQAAEKKKPKYELRADDAGAVALEEIPEGRYKVTCLKPGYIEKNFETEIHPEKGKKIKVTLVPQPKVELKGEKIEINQRVQFYFSTAKIRDESLPILQQVAQVLKEHPELRVQVEGHTDATGSAETNQYWSEERAKAVVDYLLQQELPTERVRWKGYGATRPVASNDTQEGRRTNRRVEFAIVKDNESSTEEGTSTTDRRRNRSPRPNSR